MNKNISSLVQIAQKKERLIIGLMSGTSVDGLDVALCKFSGSGLSTTVKLLNFETIAFDESFRHEVKSVFSKKMVDFEKLCVLNPWISLSHAAIINNCLKKWNYKHEEIDVIASHGQTVFHAPKFLHPNDKFGNATLQIGDGDHLAVATGIITISDFRQKHVAAGGEGAPLAVYGDYLVFSKKDEDRIMLNIGGIANFTYLPGNLNANEVFSTDTGTGNTLMDAWMQHNFKGKYFDKDAEIALRGKCNEQLLDALKKNDFFKLPFPKTIGPELFNLEYLYKAQEISGTQNILVEDVMATLNKFTADTIVDAIKKTTQGKKQFHIFSSGGGMHNPLLMKHIKAQLTECNFSTTSELEINPDAKEAVLFAILANECIAGGATELGKGRNGIPNVTMGKISFPW